MAPGAPARPARASPLIVLANALALLISTGASLRCGAAAPLHVWLGSASLGLAVVTFVLGSAGPPGLRYAAAGPAAILRDIALLLRLHPASAAGLRPALTAISILLLLVLAATAASGALDFLSGGPAKGIIIGAPPSFAADVSPSSAHADERGLHATLGTLTLALAFFYFVGAVLDAVAFARGRDAG